jgi:hypothetical protein
MASFDEAITFYSFFIDLKSALFGFMLVRVLLIVRRLLVLF